MIATTTISTLLIALIFAIVWLHSQHRQLVELRHTCRTLREANWKQSCHLPQTLTVEETPGLTIRGTLPSGPAVTITIRSYRLVAANLVHATTFRMDGLEPRLRFLEAGDELAFSIRVNPESPEALAVMAADPTSADRCLVLRDVVLS